MHHPRAEVGRGIRLEQLKVLADIAEQLGCRIVFAFGKSPTKAAMATLATYNTELAKKIGRKVGQNVIVARRWDATAQPKTSTSAAAAGATAAGKQLPAASAASEATGGSPASPEEATEKATIEEGLLQEVEQRQALAASAPICQLGRSPCRPNPAAKATVPAMRAGDIASDSDPLGGVDFSTLELRYVSDTYQGTTGMQYAYRVEPAPGQKVSYGGADAAQLASDSFFVWLALPESSFHRQPQPGGARSHHRRAVRQDRRGSGPARGRSADEEDGREADPPGHAAGSAVLGGASG